ncbi:lantibiotic dehydratase [Chryseobacterium sp. FH2]|uniref:lantibiotic dehydratase family protein n=1 Tax=Chryseobacterium sp. FH2 TaxID=1674291 RepID=UPI00065A91FF|nr:lantibiotic dehydratase family protein [Chryseobacterium sp. FH2]KMQ68014.1 lantibiotic dehydratase [Chryseobacterium sp. FH2]
MSQFPYRFFEEFVVRSPVFSRESFWNKLEGHELLESDVKQICNNPVFQEALYLASPYLYEEIRQWVKSGEKFSDKQSQKLKNTFLKYYSRMSTRCTPFGLFSNVGIGRFDNDEFPRSSAAQLIRDTKLDMHFLVALSHHLVTIPEIRNHLQYFPNNSLNRVGNKIRYVEYEYSEGKREYIVSSAPISEELDNILKFAQKGKTTHQLEEILINEEITKEDASEFIDELIDNQVLVSELEPNVSGEDFLRTLISILKKINAEDQLQTLIQIQEKLIDLDKNIGNSTAKYIEIEELIKSFQVKYEQKYLFQTDLYNDSEYKLPQHWKKELKKTVSFLNKISLIQKETYIEKFKKAFYERFETEEVPLGYALDSEIGIGYLQGIKAKGLHPYLEDLNIPFSQKKSNLMIQLNPVQQVLNGKLQGLTFESQYKIELTDADFKDFEENWDDLPDTISFMAEIISDGQEKLCIKGGGGNSAANLLGRFCSEKSEIQNLAKRIAGKEEELNPNKILAEIIHLPDARIGNIIRRPTLRNYEIPYLAQSILPEENQITIDDLYISVKNNRIILRSQRLNKEIMPYLTNAHNYSGDSLPVYHFLCDLYSQNRRSGVYFDWGGLKNIYTFFPRIEYKNVILSKAQWKIEEKDLQAFISIIKNKEDFLSELQHWRDKRKIPKWIQWAMSDNTLTINLENYDFAKLFIDIVKKHKIVFIEEFLWNKNDDYRREFVFSLYKAK